MGRNGTVNLRLIGESPRPPRRQRNIDRRPREYLTPAEVETLMATARKRSRYGHRDATMILIAYRHGLRVSELCRLEWSQIDFASGLLHVARLKGGISDCCEQLRSLVTTESRSLDHG
jgi:integrase